MRIFSSPSKVHKPNYKRGSEPFKRLAASFYLYKMRHILSFILFLETLAELIEAKATTVAKAVEIVRQKAKILK